MGFADILCAVDFSVTSRAAPEQAVALAGSEGKLTLIHVAEPPAAVRFSSPLLSDPLGELGRVSKLELSHWTAVAEERLRRPVTEVWLMGVPWQAVVEQAGRGKHDLLVIGTHGRSGVSEALLGSVAERVVRHAPCPVLVVR